MPSVMVTGASGFIGRAVCEELLKKGVSVYGLGRAKHVAVYAQVGEFGPAEMPSRPISIHLAGGNSSEYMEANFQKELGRVTALAEKIATGNFTRVVFISSAVVYGDGIQTPRREDESISPAGAYAKIKAGAETISISHGHTVARLANVYGPGMSRVNTQTLLYVEQVEL